MAAEQSTAIVLRTVEFSETSLIVSLLTRDFGRISAIAKGARRPKGPFEGALDLLAVCRIVVLRKQSDTLDLLTEAKLHRRFRGGERSLERLYAGYYVAEMLRLLTDDHDPHPDVYDLTIRTLGQIDGTGNPTLALLRFDLEILRMLGHSPGTDRCTDCGREVDKSGRITFSLSAGGIVCGNCRLKQHQTVSVRADVIEMMSKLHTAEMKGDGAINFSDESGFSVESQFISALIPLYGELRSVLNRYIQTVVGKVPRMQSFVPVKLTHVSPTTSGE
ncbi:DNA repair protein RecO [Rubripirellula amarantea]|uniref:DNA repair protein RecO n=1 Tax=Rubripirellula amarantea TaxID=2527999 RepID=A0A5C5WRY8_9BACT|nr:DNA repair protein RecO [Rubripirellula amarantea]MDA8744983.1 DNA repair protein RecO [Rubripirellula amarantea]TWT52853.1 DNA repair protein RecO [Rubripirellula amarantea]